MAILITRPDEEGKSLCQQLSQRGLVCLHHPLIKIVAGAQTATFREQLFACDIVIAVSQHAVHWADKTLTAEMPVDNRLERVSNCLDSWHNLHQSTTTWPKQVRYLAVGQKTAHYLSKASQQVVNYPSISDSEHLLALPELQDINGLRILILRGNGGRELIHQTLSQRSALVSYCEVYQRQYIEFDGSQSVKYWQAQHVDSVVVTSGEQLVHLHNTIPNIEHRWLHQLSLWVPSQRIALQAHQLGFIKINTVGSAANADLLAALIG